MKRTIAIVAALVICLASSAYALYEFKDGGDWPSTWPKELDPLRKQARTFVGPEVLNRHYAIPFTKREEFESGWPHLLKVTTKGAPIILTHAPNFFLDGKAGVVVHAPPAGQKQADGKTYLELIVDGSIVDLNRIQLPADTPIIDNRFKDGPGK